MYSTQAQVYNTVYTVIRVSDRIEKRDHFVQNSRFCVCSTPPQSTQIVIMRNCNETFAYTFEITIDHRFYGISSGGGDGFHGSNSLR